MISELLVMVIIFLVFDHNKAFIGLREVFSHKSGIIERYSFPIKFSEKFQIEIPPEQKALVYEGSMFIGVMENSASIKNIEHKFDVKINSENLIIYVF